MAIAIAVLPDNFDNQLQDGLSLGISHLNTIATVIDKTLEFSSLSDEDVQLSDNSRPATGATSSTSLVSKTAEFSLADNFSGDGLEAKLNQKVANSLLLFQNTTMLDTLNASLNRFLKLEALDDVITAAIQRIQ